MKYKGSIVLLSSLLFAVLIFAANVKAYTFGFSDRERETVNLQTFIISDFGDEKDQSNSILWKPKFSRFAKPADPGQELSGPDPKACSVEYIEAKPLGIPQEVDRTQKWALGLKAQFVKKGYNWIELYPSKPSSGASTTAAPAATGTNASAKAAPAATYSSGGSILGSGGKPDANIEATPSPLDLVGIVKSLDLWVWGGNYKYWMEFYLEDYKGFLHRLPAGDIAYVGWKNLRTKVPDYIPQAELHVPFLKSLRLINIKLWSYPTERVDQFYAYFDYMQVQTDVYVERFNGDDLANSRW